ncbi:acyl-CoA dehydrogenase [Corynebacterium propinquum]|uniref:acyl-CoA dehydrogenase family protein n=1 Tax=Corynebacterium propinquum TaxID=43769 RepID=UPI000F88BBCE|nr:acyl-CoA dehydrogenase family protein [Corynebacterium propinquum]MDK4235370.1 acyl-CoA dehydrogenase family protein [Corynebacterium propinquum]RUP78645.1 acyl-CoA dehydrogenase [Corynebacterium propinquum]RUP88682.1 acyl-CoA dehydrogenase [Corynebacterium propinquum]RUP94410.1 acyl-CoA dehydrogenase [Corynebacterium propinquum]
MTTEAKTIELAPLDIPEDIRTTLQENASAVDKGEKPARYGLELLARHGLLNTDDLVATVRLVRGLAREDLSVAFSTWADLMVLTYLKAADSQHPQLIEAIENGTRPGVTGMASVFKYAAGAGDLDLQAQAASGGYKVSGKLKWASNLADDSIIVSGAHSDQGGQILFVVDGNAEGLTLGTPFGLLGLNATASAWVEFDEVFVAEENILTTSFPDYLPRVRPTFLLLQTSECLGVAESAIAAASGKTVGINEVFADDVAQTYDKITELISTQESIAEKAASGEQVAFADLLRLRLNAAEAAVQAANLEIRVAGGAGYAQSSPASRRYREATFIPVQSPSEGQLKWQLAREES